MGNLGELNVIGPAILKVRLEQHPRVTQQDLAGRLAALGVDVDRSAIARIESGKRMITDREIIAIAAVLRVPIMKLFEPTPGAGSSKLHKLLLNKRIR